MPLMLVRSPGTTLNVGVEEAVQQIGWNFRLHPGNQSH